eukprot:6419672-Prymnesium_polylepis.2
MGETVVGAQVGPRRAARHKAPPVCKAQPPPRPARADIRHVDHLAGLLPPVHRRRQPQRVRQPLP